MENKKLQKALDDSNQEYLERLKQLESTAPDASRPGGDAKLPEYNRTVEAKKNDHISKKVYLFPESYNALRRELQENWKVWFETVIPELGMSPAYAMVFDGPQFIGMCNGYTGKFVQFDSENIDGMCTEFLNAFRAMRGVNPIH